MVEQPSGVEPITSALRPNFEVVRRFIVEMVAQGSIAMLVSAVLGLLTRMDALNRELQRKLEQSRRKKPPKETMQRLQMELPFLASKAANDAAAAKPPHKEKKQRGPRTAHQHGRPTFPEHLPRVPVVHRVPDAQRVCPSCDIECRPIGGGHVVKKLDLEPARFVVREEVCEVLGCPRCHQHIVRADKPDEVVDRGVLGNELLVQATVDHYQDAVPWERMERRARQEGVPLSANTLAHSCGKLIDLFDPITGHIFERCVSSGYFAFDATGMPVLDTTVPIGIRTGALWLLQGDHVYSYFLYAHSGHAAHVEAKLVGKTLRSAMCDGSATNNLVERAGATRGGCNAHARRKLVEALRCGDERALAGLELYGTLFHIEAQAKRAAESLAQRFLRRQQESVPVVEQLRRWVDERSQDVEPKSTLGRAVRYMRKQWRRLTEFLRDPLMELTNNEVERDLRTWVLNRKTWLFCGHDDSARRAAAALSIITTCKKLGIEPRSYIRDTLHRLLHGEKDLAALLPENYKPKPTATTLPQAVAA